MKLTGHCITSAVGAGIFYLVFRNFWASGAFFLSGVLIDLDHIFDYVVNHGLKNFSYKKLDEACEYNYFNTVTIVFHSYELLIVLWVVVVSSPLNMFWLACVAGLTLHLIVDQITNATIGPAYFFTYRILKRFDINKLFIPRKRKGG